MTNLSLLDAFLELHAGKMNAATTVACSEEFLAFCQRHQIAPYVWSLIEETEFAENLEPRVRKGFQLAQLDQWQLSEHLLRELRRLSARFQERGLEFISIKGPYLAQRFFGGIERRAYTDLDILVRPQSLSAAIELLTDDGYAAVSSTRLPGWTRRFLHQVELRRGETVLDLHHTLRAHPALRVREESLWARHEVFDFNAFSCRVLPDDLSVLVQVLSIHTDVGLGIANMKMLVDLDRVLQGCYRTIDWSAFLSDREQEGTLVITLNVFALLLTIFRNAHQYPDLIRLVMERREALVWPPDRACYVHLFTGTSLRQSKLWALRQYDQSALSAVATWVLSLPVIAMGMGGSFLGNLREKALQSGTREKPQVSSTGLWGSLPALVAGLGGEPHAIRHSRIQLGSLGFVLSYTDEKYLRMLEELFRLQAFPVDQRFRWEGEDHLLLFDVDEEQFHQIIPQPEQAIIDRPLEDIIEIHRDAACCLLRRCGTNLKIAIPVIAASYSYNHLLHCVMVVLYRALFAMESLPLHSAAIQFGATANLFIGDKGAGKSTVSLSLGRAGGRVLGEDHILLRRAKDRFLVSGCDSKGRLTAKTERQFFSDPLPVEPRRVAGVLKKEIDLADHVCSVPFEDVPVGRIFFLRVGEEFSIGRMKGAEALLRMLGMMRERQRFVGTKDRARFLDFFVDFLQSAEVWDVVLSPDLSDLDELTEFVTEGGDPRPANR